MRRTPAPSLLAVTTVSERLFPRHPPECHLVFLFRFQTLGHQLNHKNRRCKFALIQKPSPLLSSLSQAIIRLCKSPIREPVGMICISASWGAWNESTSFQQLCNAAKMVYSPRSDSTLGQIGIWWGGIRRKWSCSYCISVGLAGHIRIVYWTHSNASKSFFSARSGGTLLVDTVLMAAF